jgi:hypothetical protein
MIFMLSVVLLWRLAVIDRRLRRLEESFAPQENEEVRRLVALLRERRRRRAEASGEPFVETEKSDRS